MALHRNTTVELAVSDDAEFRLWVTALRAAIVAAGLVHVSGETGTIDVSTVSRPGTNADGGFDVFRFDDTEQATLPCFVKVTYGVGNVATKPRVKVEVAEGTNGSGTLTGDNIAFTDQSGITLAPSSSPTDEVAGLIHAASSEGSLVVVMSISAAAPSTSSNLILFCVERLRDIDGVQKAGFYIGYVGHASGISQWTVDAADNVLAQTDTGYLTPSPGGSAIDGGNTNLGAFFPTTKKVEAPIVGMIPFKATDMTQDVTGEVARYGDNLPYRAWQGFSSHISSPAVNLLVLNG